MVKLVLLALSGALLMPAMTSADTTYQFQLSPTNRFRHCQPKLTTAELDEYINLNPLYRDNWLDAHYCPKVLPITGQPAWTTWEPPDNRWKLAALRSVSHGLFWPGFLLTVTSFVIIGYAGQHNVEDETRSIWLPTLTIGGVLVFGGIIAGAVYQNRKGK